MTKNSKRAQKAARRAVALLEKLPEETKDNGNVTVHFKPENSTEFDYCTEYERKMLAHANALKPTIVDKMKERQKEIKKNTLPDGDIEDSYYDSMCDAPSAYGKGPNYFLCKPKPRKPYHDLSLGECSVHFGTRSEPAPNFGNITQVVLGGRIGLLTQKTGCLCFVYTKERVYTCEDSFRSSVFDPVASVWSSPEWPLPPQSTQAGGAECDVYSAKINLSPIIPLLNHHANLTQDRPIPRYQMIVDPNQFVCDGQWVASEFLISPQGKAKLLGEEASHLYPSLARQVAVPVLQAALPLLGKLRRPALLLPQQRLQVVFKAQRIILPPASTSSASTSSCSSSSSNVTPSEYVGLWHVDGDKEHVVAVVLYYYHVHSGLIGGDLEFMGREPLDVLGYGDCSNNLSLFDKQNKSIIRSALKTKTMVHCRTSISTGSLVVFSNYQMIHRVLKMINTSPEEASRDFVALFIIDPLHPLKTAQSFLQKQILLRKTLCGVRLPRSLSPSSSASSSPSSLDARTSPSLVPSSALRLSSDLAIHILEFCGVVLTKEQKMAQRNRLLRQQLKPKGKFGNAGYVYSTGNGCFTMIGWLDSLLADDPSFGEGYYGVKNVHQGLLRTNLLNKPPDNIDRGMSEILSTSTSIAEEFSFDSTAEVAMT